MILLRELCKILGNEKKFFLAKINSALLIFTVFFDFCVPIFIPRLKIKSNHLLNTADNTKSKMDTIFYFFLRMIHP